MVSSYDHLARKDARHGLDEEATGWRDTIAETLLVFSNCLLDEQAGARLAVGSDFGWR